MEENKVEIGTPTNEGEPLNVPKPNRKQKRDQVAQWKKEGKKIRNDMFIEHVVYSLLNEEQKQMFLEIMEGSLIMPNNKCIATDATYYKFKKYKQEVINFHTEEFPTEFLKEYGII